MSGQEIFMPACASRPPFLRFISISSMIAAGFAAAFVFGGSHSAFAQGSEHEWHKTYPVGGSSSFTVETGDSNLDIRSCGGCSEIRVQVHSDRKLSDFVLEEHQDQDRVYFSLKEKPHVFRMQIHWKNSQEPQVSVETPAKLTLEAKTADGSFAAHHLTGSLQVHSGDGSVLLEDVRGELRLRSSDGNITIHDATGTLEARTSDGHMKVDGQFSEVQLHTSDGGLEFALAPGSKLTAASRIESSDGVVSIRVPKDLAAELDVSTSDGRVDCSLPLTVDGYRSADEGHHHLRGRMNAGSVPLSIHTSDGNVSITAL
jgi:DUF4097 and DUF4098 domain-containing protein YvlB